MWRRQTSSQGVCVRACLSVMSIGLAPSTSIRTSNPFTISIDTHPSNATARTSIQPHHPHPHPYPHNNPATPPNKKGTTRWRPPRTTTPPSGAPCPSRPKTWATTGWPALTCGRIGTAPWGRMSAATSAGWRRYVPSCVHSLASGTAYTRRNALMPRSRHSLTRVIC